MKLRTLKRIRQNQMAWILEDAYWQRRIDQMMEMTPEEKAASMELMRARTEQLFKDIGLGVFDNAVEEAKTFKVARVKDNEVVLEAKTIEEANEAIEKAAKQKKAKLHILETA